MTGEITKKHTLCLDQRAELKIDGVEKVDSFSDNDIVLQSIMGKLTIKGENLHIEKLNVDTGEFSATGKVTSIVYSKATMQKGSFIERLFK